MLDLLLDNGALRLSLSGEAMIRIAEKGNVDKLYAGFRNGLYC